MFAPPEKDFYLPSSFAVPNTFEAILADERPSLVRFCTQLVGNPAIAEDIVQETLLEAWKNQHKVREGESLANCRKWLRAIARNVCLRWLHNNKRDLTHLVTDADETIIDNSIADDVDLELELEREELAMLLDKALSLLPPSTSEILIERYIRDSPLAEIAERLGLSEDAIAQRLHRGKLALKRVIITHMPEEARLYGLSLSEEDKCLQETRILCPMCGKGHLIKYQVPSNNITGFTCSKCWHIAAQNDPRLWMNLTSPKSILTRQLALLGSYYWQAINKGYVACPKCGNLAYSRIWQPEDIPKEYLPIGYPGVYIACPTCKEEELNVLPHLTLDTPEAQQFYRKHPHIRWQPGNAIEYDNQPALICSFQSIRDPAQLDVIFHHDTLKVLGVFEQAR